MAVEKGSKVWTVRGVPVDVQAAVSEAAKAHGMHLGAMVTTLLRKALASGPAHTADIPAADNPRQLDLVELCQRLERLEGEVRALAPAPRQKAANAPEASGAADVPAVRQDAPEGAGKGRKGTISDAERRMWFMPPKYARINEAGKAEIRRRLAAGQSEKEVGRVFGMSQQAVNRHRPKDAERVEIDFPGLDNG